MADVFSDENEANQIYLPRVILLSASMVICLTLMSAQTIVKGRVIGADNQPMTLAHISLERAAEGRTLETVAADTSGGFTVTISQAGIWTLRFSGVSHKDYRLALYIDRPQTMELVVRLDGYRYLRNFDQAKIVGDFNRWYLLSGVPLRRQADGTYAGEIETKADTVAYQLNGVRDGGSVEGTHADRYRYNGDGGYISVLDVHPGKVRILFDPAKISESTDWAKVTFMHASRLVTRFATIYDELQRYREDYLVSQRDFLRSGKLGRDFSYDWSKPLSSFEKQLAKEKNRVLRGELSLCRMTIARSARRIDTSMCVSCLREISPASRTWSLDAHGMFYVLARSGWTEIQRDAYVQRTLKKHPDERVRAALLYDLFMEAKLSDHRQKADKYYHLLVDGYAKTPEAASVREQSH